ncbi:MAG TPA: hypothetical protein VGN72_22725 [Tepidisphaeraceae bacterium]|jgi:hypothetical protein|nr:hypothetical protein [Tepidisphaeraceae bacterium]
MEEADGAVRVIFPVDPTWVYVFPIVGGAIAGFGQGAAIFALSRFIWWLGPAPFQLPGEIRWQLAKTAAVLGLAMLFWWSIAAFHWWRYRRWGRVPRIITVSDRQLVVSDLGMWRMRERAVAADDIVKVEYRPITRNIAWWRTAGDLYLHRSKGRRLQFRFSSDDPDLPKRIAQRIADQLRRPLTGAT